MTNLIKIDCDYEKFNRFTCGLFKDNFKWDNCVVAGGSIYKIYSDCNEDTDLWKQSDIDLFIIAEDNNARQATLDYLLNYFKDSIFIFHNSVFHLYFKGINRVLQIICCNFENEQKMIENFDYSHLELLYNGVNFYCSETFKKYINKKQTKFNKKCKINDFRLYKTLLTNLEPVGDSIEIHSHKKNNWKMFEHTDFKKRLKDIYFPSSETPDEDIKLDLIKRFNYIYEIPKYFIFFVINNKNVQIKWCDFNKNYNLLYTKKLFHQTSIQNQVIKVMINYMIFNRLDLLKTFYMNIFKIKDTINTEILQVYLTIFVKFINSDAILKWIYTLDPSLETLYEKALKSRILKCVKIPDLESLKQNDTVKYEYYLKYEKPIIFISKIFIQLQNNEGYLENDYVFDNLDLLKEYINEYYLIIKKKYNQLFANNLRFTFHTFSIYKRIKTSIHTHIEKEIFKLLFKLNFEKFGNALLESGKIGGTRYTNYNICTLCYFMDIECIKSYITFLDIDLHKLKECFNYACYSGNLELVKYIRRTIQLQVTNCCIYDYDTSIYSIYDYRTALYYSCKSGNIKVLKYIIQNLDLDIYALYNQLKCKKIMENHSNICLIEYCNCLFCGIVYDQHYDMLNYILRIEPRFIKILKELFPFIHNELMAVNNISEWWLKILYNPHTSVGQKYALKKIKNCFA